MNKSYEFLEGANNYLAIKLDLKLGKKLRALSLTKSSHQILKEKAEKILCFDRFNFIKQSCLLESLSVEGISGDSLYMAVEQRKYFLGNNWENEESYFPFLIGTSEGIIYLPKDNIGQKENLKKLWEIYFNQMKQTLE